MAGDPPALGLADPAAAPVAVRPAATVMLVRDAEGGGPGGIEVLMVRRSLAAVFVGGAHVFPGGAVDPADLGAEATAGCAGRADAEASALLGVAAGGLAYWVAAVRECFEEAGILLAYRGAGRTLLSPGDPAAAARLAAARRQVNGGSRGFLDLCRDEGLRLAVDRVHYFAHWVTPPGAPRRFDTRFFVAATPPGQVPASDQAETIAAEWIRPRDALARLADGGLGLILPTIRNLQAIGRFDTVGDLLETVAATERAPGMPPRLVPDGNGVRILLPGDPGYEAVAPDRPDRGTGVLGGPDHGAAP